MEKRGAVFTIRMNRPDRMNEYRAEMGRGLVAAAEEAARDAGVRCIVLPGAGKAFSAGGDVVLMGSIGCDLDRVFLDLTEPLHAFIVALRRAPKPVISAVNGVAAGAGFSMALAKDVVVAAASARFALGYPNLGPSPDGWATYFLARGIGRHRAMELTLWKRILSAVDAAQWRLVSQVIADADFGEEVARPAGTAAAGPTGAYARAKRLYDRALF